MPTTRLKIAKLADATDAAHLEKALEAVPGVESVHIDTAFHEAIVDHGHVNAEELTTAIKRLGYIAMLE